MGAEVVGDVELAVAVEYRERQVSSLDLEGVAVRHVPGTAKTYSRRHEGLLLRCDAPEQRAALQYRRTRPAGKHWLCARIVTYNISDICPSQSSLDDAAASWSE